jgi:hypothetical protein
MMQERVLAAKVIGLANLVLVQVRDATGGSLHRLSGCQLSLIEL